MDNMALYHYRVVFERDFLEKKGDAYQDFFSTIMEKRYPSDFMRTRPWGRQGDRKNDGYLRSKRILFQVYAPNEVSSHDTLKKINEDYDGAKSYWSSYFDQWAFVHNAPKGLPPDVIEKLLELDRLQPPKVIQWGREELWNEASQLDVTHLSSLFGPPVSWKDMLQLGLQDIQTMLANIADKASSNGLDLRPFTLQDKISSNGLSDSSKELLKLGMQGSRHVGNFFDTWHDATYGERIATAFKSKYLSLRNEGKSSDDIFTKLWEFTGGREAKRPQESVAVYAIMFYFFENCDIFERPSTRISR